MPPLLAVLTYGRIADGWINRSNAEYLVPFHGEGGGIKKVNDGDLPGVPPYTFVLKLLFFLIMPWFNKKLFERFFGVFFYWKVYFYLKTFWCTGHFTPWLKSELAQKFIIAIIYIFFVDFLLCYTWCTVNYLLSVKSLFPEYFYFYFYIRNFAGNILTFGHVFSTWYSWGFEYVMHIIRE